MCNRVQQVQSGQGYQVVRRALARAACAARLCWRGAADMASSLARISAAFAAAARSRTCSQGFSF